MKWGDLVCPTVGDQNRYEIEEKPTHRPLYGMAAFHYLNFQHYKIKMCTYSMTLT